MSGATWVQKALETSDPATADRYLLEALREDPDLGAAYAHRARLAANRGDAVAAAFHFRVAYARGDRELETRTGLALCLAAAGQSELAERIREGAATPASVEELGAAAEVHSRAIRGVLALPLPPRGEPALLPGEKLPSAPSPAAPAAAPPETAIRETAEQASFSRVGQVSSSPAAAAIRVTRPPPSSQVMSTAEGMPIPTLFSPSSAAGASVVTTLPGVPAASISAPSLAISVPEQAIELARPSTPAPANLPPPPRLTPRRLPDWVDQIDRAERPAVPTATAPADWITSNMDLVAPSQIQGAIELPSDDETLSVSHDAGAPGFNFRSAVTGRIVRADDLVRERSNARMPALEPVPDLLAKAPVFADLLETRRLVFAVELPGPVLTMPGVAPRPLCRLMAFAATRDELFFRDIDRAGVAPVRLSAANVARMDVVNDDQQISFALRDGRQLHLDLRALARHHGASVRQLVRRLTEILPDAVS